MKQVKVFMTLTLKKIWSDCFMEPFKKFWLWGSASDSDSNKNSNQMNRQNVVKIPIYDLIYNTTRFNYEFLENTRVNRYCMFVFRKLEYTKEYVYSESKTFKFNPGENNTVEIALGNEKIKGLKLFIKQKGNEDNYIDDIMLEGDKRFIQMSFFESSSFVCLDGKFEEGKLKKLVCFNKKKNNEECCVANFDFPSNFSEESWNKLVVDVKFAQEKGNKKMIIRGKVVSASSVGGVLLNKDSVIFFDPFFIALNLQESGINVIRNGKDEKIMSFCFIKSDYFRDTDWHFDDMGCYDFENTFVSYQARFLDGDQGHYIDIYGLKIFICSGSKEYELSDKTDSDFRKWDSKQQMRFLKDKGFAELELHKIRYTDPENGQKISKLVFLPVNSLEQEIIKESLIYQLEKSNEDEMFYKGQRYSLEKRKEKWKKLASETLIIGTKPKIVNTVVLKINKESFLNFLSRNLENKFSSYGLTDYYFTVRINGEENVDKAKMFGTVCNNKDDRSKEIILEHNDNIHQFSLQVDNCSYENEALCFNKQSKYRQKVSSLTLVLQKDINKKLAFFYGNKTTDIEITSNEQTEITVKKNEYGQLELWSGDKKLDVKLNNEIPNMPKTENQNNINKYQSFHK